VPVTPILLTGDQKPEKQVCKKTVRTGTIAGVERTCMTLSEWKKQSDETKMTYEELQGRRGSTNDMMCQGVSCDSAAQRSVIEGTTDPVPR
jgi:hypothetical protein